MRPADIGILAADEALLAVDKPAEMAVIPERALLGALCLTEALEGRWGRLWVVHRIDRDTSGVVVLARTAESHRVMNDQFASHRVLKTYHLIVRGDPPWAEMTVEARLRPDGDSRHRTVVDERRGKPALTLFRVLARYGSCALLEARPQTGRTHQIRVHAASTGHAIVGDPLYGDGEPLLLSAFARLNKRPPQERPLIGRVALHALELELEHPVSGARLRYGAPYRKDMSAAMAQLARWSRR